MWFVVAKKLGWILIILILISTMMRKSVYFGYKIICINVQLFFSSNSYNSMYLVHVCSTKKRSENKVGKHYSIIGMWIPISVHNWSELCDNLQCLTMCKVFANTWFQSKRHTELLFFQYHWIFIFYTLFDGLIPWPITHACSRASALVYFRQWVRRSDFHRRMT